MTHVASDSLADRFKAGFRRHAAGVAIVVGETAQGPVGATVSSVASVSVTPPLLSFSLARASTVGPQLVGCDALSVFLLTADQADLARAYADRRAERFTAAQGWVRDERGLVLPDAVAAVKVAEADKGGGRKDGGDASRSGGWG